MKVYENEHFTFYLSPKGQDFYYRVYFRANFEQRQRGHNIKLQYIGNIFEDIRISRPEEDQGTEPSDEIKEYIIQYLLERIPELVKEHKIKSPGRLKTIWDCRTMREQVIAWNKRASKKPVTWL